LACPKELAQEGNKTKYQEISLVDFISLNASRMYIMSFFIITPVI
jgi:hypothetical protein